MIDLDRVSKSYNRGQPAVDAVSLHVDKGEFVFVVGESGSGKSTLIKLLLKELDPTNGIITVNGHVLNTMKRNAIPKYRRELGVVFQDFRLLNDRNVYENVAFAQHVVEAPGRVIRKRVPETLRLVGLAEKYKSLPLHLSGGEQQLVIIARAIAQGARILIMDEPTSSLDYGNQMRVQKQLTKLIEDGYTIIQSSHNPEQAYIFADRIICIRDGRIYRQGRPEEVLDEQLIRDLYNIDVEMISSGNDKARFFILKQ